MAVRPVAILPALCTLGNAFCGFLAVSKAADAVSLLGQGPPPPDVLVRFHALFGTACWLIFAANVFDALDGRLARMTKATSDFGAMLDSLCDMLTFGAAPAFLLKLLFEAERRMAELPFQPKLVLLMGFLYVSCAALRLARFTAETEDDADAHDFFRGLPTPAAAGFVAGGVLLFLRLGEPGTPAWLAAQRGWLLSFLFFCLPLLAFLMVSHVKYVHLVNRFMRGRHPRIYVAQIVFALLLLSLIPEFAIAAVAIGYVLASPVISLLERALKRPLWPDPHAAGDGDGGR